MERKYKASEKREASATSQCACRWEDGSTGTRGALKKSSTTLPANRKLPHDSQERNPFLRKEATEEEDEGGKVQTGVERGKGGFTKFSGTTRQ